MTHHEPTYLLTGATGFLGRHLIERLREQIPGCRIVALTRAGLTDDALEPYLEGVIGVVGDAADPTGWQDDPAVSRLDGIFHLAAEVHHSRTGYERMVAFNVDATLAMVRLAAHRGCRVVFASTSGTIGCSRDPDYEPDENAPWCEDVVARWPYYRSKIEAERRAQEEARESGVTLVAVRPPVLLGPGDHKLRSSGNVLRVLERRLPFLLNGEMHFTDIRDVAAATARAMVIDNPREAYNLPGHRQTLDAFFRDVADAAGLKPSWRILPGRLVGLAARANAVSPVRTRIIPDPVVVEMARHHWGISSLWSKTDLGFVPRDPGETIRDTVRWLQERTARPTRKRI